MFFVSLRFIKRGSLGSGVSILSRTVELVQQPAKPLMGGGTKLQEQKQNKQIILGMITEGFLVFMCAPGFFLENSFGVTEWWNIDFECFHSFFFSFVFTTKHMETLLYRIISSCFQRTKF